MNDTQLIGFDCGRGFVKAYSEVNKVIKEVMFKSVIGDGREDKVEYNNYNNSIFISYEGIDYFVGSLAEKESYSPIRNSQDSKISQTVKVLLAATLDQIAVKDKVKIMFGVPYKNYTQKTLIEIQNTYKGKSFSIKNKLNGTMKTILIEDVDIFREGDAALLCHVDKHGVSSNDIGMVTIGFRTTEFSYYDKNLTYIDLKSDTIENGNKNILEYIQKRLKDEGTMRTLAEIDSSDRYDDLKEMGYRNLVESTEQDIEKMWKNGNEVDVFIAGGTSLNMDFKKYPVIEDAQMITSKGLFLVGTERF